MLRFRSLASLLAGAATLAVAFGASAETIKVGVTAGPHAQILEAVKPIAAKDGLDIQIIEFTDYVIPNQALAGGDLDANSFQHQPYLDNQVKDRGFDLVSVGKTVVYPIGIYSKKVKSLDELPSGAKVAIPNDPTNGGRVLLLLQAKGLIKLKDGGNLKASPIDIVENPKKLEIVELDAAQLPRSLDDVTVAAINTNFALEAGIDPVKDAIAREAADSPYANVIAVRKADKDKPWVAKLVKAYNSPEVKEFILTKFKNAVVPAF
ncbi:MetQ/NlpA family ABC transporter substrate-binding protein (plasmid) [Azospirillum oryzae]|uniref:MetQ/NlpA family ABC transporter substrate-binding protein n=1 Tax=Azospirillum oryzae TaxID=286727 RepID=A0A6N1AEB8_9PROT|nr:MetQ/NlpA family ABC transporter substrate-binding protein [Azospirillum oryzae]KAA0588523.1 MetQ/NlpA family ABC transporter substrate-binding protein [Azospirillum oryzae]QKS49873.1 MetQ/NlpA family ABC transporter substrate-binding protein [Azospirillum oryzae]